MLLAASAVLVPAASAQAAEPILFVHGWNSSGSVWNTMISRFQADGFTNLNNWSYNTAQSNKTTASQIATKVSQIRAATGAAKVDIITHSMGGLSSRWYVKFLGGSSSVDEWVSLGGPNHGTNTANLCFWQTSCFEMNTALACLQTSCREMYPGSSFLTALNATDETWGTPRYATWWSPCDEVINPDSSILLSGATNTQTACISHSSYYSSSTVYAQVRDFVR